MTIVQRKRQILCIRVGAVTGVFASAFAYYQFYICPLERTQSTARVPDVMAWESAKLPFWSRLDYTSLRDRRGLTDSIAAAVSRTWQLSRLDTKQKYNLVQTLSTFFIALGATGPEEYLSLIKPLRHLRQNPQEDATVRLAYKKLMGRPMPTELTAIQTLVTFWKGRTGGVSRPIEASLNDPSGIAFGIGDYDANWKSKNWQNDSAYLEVWGNPVSNAFINLTAPPEISRDIINKDGTVLRVDVDTVLRNAQRRCVPICVRLFWSTNTNQWCVEFTLIQLDENFFWPI